jgi:hypothetical protein
MSTIKKTKFWKENIAYLLLMHLNCDWFEDDGSNLNDEFFENCTLLFRGLFVCLHEMGKRLNTKFEGIGHILERYLNTLQYIIPNKKFAKVRTDFNFFFVFFMFSLLDFSRAVFFVLVCTSFETFFFFIIKNNQFFLCHKNICFFVCLMRYCQNCFEKVKRGSIKIDGFSLCPY